MSSVDFKRQLDNAIGEGEHLLAAEVARTDELLAGGRYDVAQKELLHLSTAQRRVERLVHQPGEQVTNFDQRRQSLLLLREAAHER